MEKIDISRTPLPIDRICGVLKRTNRQVNVKNHIPGRPSDALCYILEGSCDYFFDDGEKFSVSSGQILYLANGAVYDMIVQSSSYSFIFCNFFFVTDQPRKSAVYTPTRASDAENLFKRLLYSWNGGVHDAFFRGMSLLYEIYGLFGTGGRSYITTNQAKYIESAENAIRRHFQNPDLSISSLAEQAGVSEVYFRKIFQARWGISPSRYLLSVRLEHAKELLSDRGLTVEECACQCGFNSTSYFCRIFRREVGTTPAQYRRNGNFIT